MQGALLVLGGILAVFGFLAFRHPVLFRMGARNALRRKTQTVVVIAGLMVGTAIIAGSFATADSLEYGIEKAAYDGLGPTDVFVRVEGGSAFPALVYEELAANRTLQGELHAMAPRLFQEAALTHPENRLSEPQVRVMGFDPALDRPFERFTTVDGRVVDGSELGENEIYLSQSVAERLDAEPGDEIALNYAIPRTPVLPRFHTFEDTLTASAGACPETPPESPVTLPPETPCEYASNPGEATFTFPGERASPRITALVEWGGQTRQDLDVALVAPDGTRYVNANGTPSLPDVPAVVNATPADGDRYLPRGNWTLEVRAKAAADQPFRALVLAFREVYDLQELRNFTQEAEEMGFTLDDFETFGAGPGGIGLERANVTVRDVVRWEGKADFLGTQTAWMRLEDAQRLYRLEDRIDLIIVSNTGSVEEGHHASPQVTAALNASLAALRAEYPDDPAIGAVKAEDIKGSWLASAKEFGDLFKQFLTTIGSFTVIAGIMLIINIFVMLAEERKSELGMARAVGLTRRQLVLLFSFEGLLYALAASAVGVLLGLGLAWGLIRGLNNLAQSDPDGLVEVVFHPAPEGVLLAFVIGFLITLATVVLASQKVSRLNVVRAIRRIEDPPKRTSLAVALTGALLTAVGGILAYQGFLLDAHVAKVLGPPLALIGLGFLSARWLPRRIVYPVSGAAVATYCMWTLLAFDNPSGTLNQLMGPVRGVLIVLAVVLIVMFIPQLVPLVRGLLFRFRRLTPAVYPGVAYPLEKKVRTGLTMTMFSLVILVVVVFSVFSATFAVDLKEQSGGYDVDGETTVPIVDLEAHFRERAPDDVEDPFPLIHEYATLRYARSFGGEMVRIDGDRIHYQGPPVDYVYAYGDEFAETNAYGFESLHPDYATAEEAYRAVLEDPSLVIASSWYNFKETGEPGAHQPGDVLTLTTPTGDVNFTVIGFQKQLYLRGLFVHPDVLDANFQQIRGEYLFKLNPGVDAGEAAKTIEAAFQDAGMNAVSIEAEAAEQLEQNRQFLTLFQLFLGFGLVVGIASLGIVTARSVIERRQEVGMLRAIGYPPGQILRIFLIEILFTTTFGVVIGTAIGVFVAWGVTTSSESLGRLGVEFTVPWMDLLKVILVTYVAVLACTWMPARRASRTPPAEAVRYVE